MMTGFRSASAKDGIEIVAVESVIDIYTAGEGYAASGTPLGGKMRTEPGRPGRRVRLRSGSYPRTLGWAGMPYAG